MTVIRRLHLFHFLNKKAYYFSFHQFLDSDGNLIYDSRDEVRSFGRIVDWVLDMIDNIVYERLGLGYAVDDLRFDKFLANMEAHDID